MSLTVNLHGRLLPAARARISALDRGFLFGDSIYEVLRTFDGRPFAVAEHLERLAHSAARLALALPWTAARFARELDRTLAHNRRRAPGGAERYLRLVVTRGEGPLALDPAGCDRARVVIYCQPWREHPAAWYRRGLPVVLARVRRNDRRALDPDIKSGNYLNNMLALMEARQAGAVEALMLNPQGRLCEATTSNVFVVQGGRVLTPPVSAGLLRGITRAMVLALARGLGLPAAERSLRPADLFAADEVFLSSTLKLVVPVVRVDDRPIGTGRPGPVAKALLEALRAEIARRHAPH